MQITLTKYPCRGTSLDAAAPTERIVDCRVAENKPRGFRSLTQDSGPLGIFHFMTPGFHI